LVDLFELYDDARTYKLYISLAYRTRTGDEASGKRTSRASAPRLSKNPPKFKAIIMRKRKKEMIKQYQN